jgi:signal transduction histidine kinase
MANGGSTREVRALRNLHDLITTVHGMQDLEEVLQAIVQGVVDVIGFQVAVIDCVDASGYVEALAVAGDEAACQALKSRRMPLSEFLDEWELAEEWGLLRFVPHDRLPPDAVSTWVPDFEPSDDPNDWHPLDSLYALLRGPTGALLGVLSVDLPTDGRRPGPLGRQVLEMYAVQAGLAIHHAQERARLEERVRLAAATRTVVETASRELDLRRIAQDSFRPLVDGFRCDLLMVRVLDPGDSGVDEGLEGAGATYPPDLMGWLGPRLERLDGAGGGSAGARILDLGERVARDCWAARRVFLFADAKEPPDPGLARTEERLVRALLDSLDAGSLMVVPLGAGQECLGYLTMVRQEQGAAWSEPEVEAALEVGREIGRAVNQARLYQRERQLVAELKELDQYKGEMIATLTHELRNPLAAIAGHVELLSDLKVAPASVGAIARNADRLSRLVENLLLLTKVKDPHRPFIPVRVDLSRLVAETCDLFAVQAQRRGVALVAREVPSGVAVEGDEEELGRVLANLVGNAVKYSPDGGRVALALRADPDAVVFTCSDDGIGIAPHDLDTLFDEFDRSSNPAAHEIPGTGLGLAIVRRIAERHGGSVQVRSVLGEGSVFEVRLPRR